MQAVVQTMRVSLNHLFPLGFGIDQEQQNGVSECWPHRATKSYHTNRLSVYFASRPICFFSKDKF